MKSLIRYLLCLMVIWGEGAPAAEPDLKTRVGALDTPGGLVVHVGSRNLEETVALRKGGSFLIHVLYADPAESEKASVWVAEKGLSGKVTVSTFDGSGLPFIDNVVNLLIAEEGFNLSMAEMERVVTSRGKILWKKNGEWQQEVKEVPSTIDDWTHNLYDAGNTGVSRDMEAGSPRHLQWSGDPRFSRNHDGNTSFVAMVSCGGRIFYLMDEGSTAFLSLPPHWTLTARDGFNGKVLWKKPLDEAMISPIGNIKNSFANLGHRMVAQNDVLYATLGFDAAVSALDSRTGEQIWKSPETKNAEELILYNGVLYCVVNLSTTNQFKDFFMSMESIKQALASSVSRTLVAVDAKTGALLWQKSPPTILPLSLTVGKAGVFIHNGNSIVCLEPRSGKEVWRSEPIDVYKKLILYSGVNVVLKDDVLLFACGTAYPHKDKNYQSPWQNTITALDATTGNVLWRAPARQDGYFTTPDLFVADGLVWTAPIDSGNDSGDYVGLDLKTGKVVKDFKGDGRRQMPHHRCYRNRATERCIFTGRTGINIFDIKSGTWDENYWLRGACRYGVMPANGLLYNTPSVCTCFINAKIKGINALADHTKSRMIPDAVPEKGRLIKGPAYPSAGIKAQPQGRVEEMDWPTFRRTVSRSGVSSSPLGEAYAAGWKTSVGGKLTQPVVADGTVFVAAADQHAVYALNESDGKVRFRFQAGGLVNSPPTIWKGRTIFGCNDGWVYCLDAKTGTLAWKYRAAPVDRRLVVCENLESVWPVDGSVLLLPDATSGKGKVYCIGGRSVYLDGGLRYLMLDAETGENLSETLMNGIDPQTGENIQKGHEWPPDLPAGLPDVLSYSGDTIYMGIQPLSPEGKLGKLYYPSRSQYPIEGRGAKPMLKRPNNTGVHLFSTIGFLDDSEMHRSVWMYGKDSFGGCWEFPVPTFVNPSGQMLCVKGDTVYGYGRQFYNEGRQPFMHLFAMDKNPKSISYAERFKNAKKKDRRGGAHIQSGTASVPVCNWSTTIDTYIRALLVAPNRTGESDLLFAIGFPEVIDEYDAIDLITEHQRKGSTLERIFQKEKSAAGELGAKLLVVSTADGNVISETKLDYPSVFDGMSAANGNIFVSDIRGNLICLKPR